MVDSRHWRSLGLAHATDVERVPLARAAGRVLAESIEPSGLEAGRRLMPRDLAAMALLGRAEVRCRRRPTVAVFTLGDGLVPLGQTAVPGQRVDACRPLLMALLQQAGVEPVAWPLLPATGALTASALQDAAQAFDVVVACGPISPIDPKAVAPQAAAFGHRQPQSLLVVLPDEVDALDAAWGQTLAVLLDAMQGLSVDGRTDLDAAVAPAVRPGQGGAGLEISAREAFARLVAGARLIDLREDEERVLGTAQGAEAFPMSRFDTDPQGLIGSGASNGLLLLCASGKRSLRAAERLQELGLGAVASVGGGFAAWHEAGLPVEGPLPADALARYDRHLRLAGVGLDGQKRLLGSRVVIIGAGGLGSPVALYLAAAGVGTLVLVDDDRVERSNLQRQVLHTDAAVGAAKVESARDRLKALNPAITIEAIPSRLTPENVEALLQGADVVVDGSDNFATRYLVDAACLQLRLPLVYGAVERFTGQVAVFDAGRRRGEAPCYRCLFPEPPGADAAPNCAEAGVLGVLPGLVGLLQATEVLKVLLGLGEPLVGRLLTVDALAMRFRELRVPVDPACPGCGAGASFMGYPAIEAFCASGMR